MTSVFSADGKNVPCTVIEAGPCVVTQVKSVEKDGYKAVQLAFGEKKDVPEVLLIQAGWTLILVLFGCALWHRNQQRLIIQGG